MAPFDLGETDRLLTTTRSVRKRLDLEQPVERELLLECVGIAQQAPTAGNAQGWRWLFLTDAKTKTAIADLYRRGADGYGTSVDVRALPPVMQRIADSASYLVNNLEHVPVLAIPCLVGRPPSRAPVVVWTALLASIFPAVWSFQLALRARGLGSCITSFHLRYEAEAAELLGIPDDVLQVALLPIAYTRGDDFKPADRPPPEQIVHWDTWAEDHP